MSIVDYLKKEKFVIGKEIIISIVVSALVSSIISFNFDKIVDTRTTKRQLIYEYSRTFSDNPKYRNISTAIEEQYLYSRGKIFTINGGDFSDYDIDDYLYFLYDIYALGEEKLIGYTALANQFAYYVCITFNNQEIKEYRERLLKEGFSDELANGFLIDFAKSIGISEETNCKNF